MNPVILPAAMGNGIYLPALIYLFWLSILAECDSRSDFNRSLAGLYSDFSFSETGCLIKAKKKPTLSYYSPIARRENNWIYTFPNGISAM